MSDPEVDEQGRPGRWVLTDDPPVVRLAPVEQPGEMDGFRLARVFETPLADGRPRVDAARGRMTDVQERRRVLNYLESATVIADFRTRSGDLLEPRRLGAIPNVFRTDGRWIWHDSVAYYLRWHLVPPEPDFLAHIAAAGYRPAPAGPDTVAAAVQAASKADAIYSAQRDRWTVEQRLVADPARFPRELQGRLFAIGWRPDRDVSAEVEPWLAGEMERLRELHGRIGRFALPEPFEAARKVFAEFGGLQSRDNAGGITSARVPFVIFPPPLGDPKSLLSDAFDVMFLGSRLHQPVFQLGYVEDGETVLVMAEDGSVHLTGAVERLAGATFDEAIAALMNGDLPEEPPGPGGSGSAP
ncbi:SUKH-3 domain-containing protein [Dactylosporangium sp. CA-139066]|uniref:SUKH-3 domain-containing protein n=1 Tax=Dactylosporangium sp. CA-139066 TaxID=3239930 RepID=UPI003D94A206